MKPLLPLVGLCVAAASALHMQTALAADPHCWVRPDNIPTMTYPLNLGTVYVPSDARTGSVIGMFDQPFSMTASEGRFVQCETDGSTILGFNALAAAPIFTGTLPPVQGEDVTGKVFETGIPGIGAIVKLGHPFDGLAADSFIPLTPPVVPFNARLAAASAPVQVRPLQGRVTLVKTGPIAPGPQSIDTALFYGRFSLVPRTMDFQLRATVVQAQCTSSTVSDDPVMLGDWRASDFARPGYGTAPVPFTIRLGNCESDPGDVNVAWATLKLDGVSGSTPIAGVDGAFTLATGSTAAGVAIQVMRGDGLTPIKLGQEVAMVPVSTGTTVMDLSARYYQTGDSRDIRPGLAKGALNFTLSYQ
ncbi:MAG: fimbrial protein [Pseudomonas orientalis]|nr:fimbrial protein [Pseudomonas orientalis]